MPLSKQDKDFLLSDITPISPKLLNIDRVFTNLLPLLKHGGAAYTRGVRSRPKLVQIDDLVGIITQDDHYHFEGFADYPDITYKWLESDFLSLVNRGKGREKQQIAAPLPMHLNTYKLRNTKYCRDYGVSEQIFALLYYGARNIMWEMKDFLFEGADPYTDKYDSRFELDIETLLMMRLLDQKERDFTDQRTQSEPPKPLCLGQAKLLGDDIARILAYKGHIPRLTLIEYIKNVMALHVGIYTLRLFRILPDLVERGSFHPDCRNCPVSQENEDFFDLCHFPINLVVDMGEDYKSTMAEIARQSFVSHSAQLNQYVKAHIRLKKLSEFADELVQKGRIHTPQSLEEILELQNYHDTLELKTFFEIRIRNLMEQEDGEPDERLVAIRRMGLSELDTYVEMIFFLRQSFHQSYHYQLLDSLFQKNNENGLLKQGYGRINKRRFSIGSGLLETLVQIAVIETEEGNFKTRTIRIDDFIEWLRRRYGIYISRLPDNSDASISDLEALRNNVNNFKLRLREIGFYTDLSDAYISQVIRPRYHID